jgi:hypothetical protein
MDPSSSRTFSSMSPKMERYVIFLCVKACLGRKMLLQRCQRRITTSYPPCQILIRVVACGICHTDLWSRSDPEQPKPMVYVPVPTFFSAVGGPVILISVEPNIIHCTTVFLFTFLLS